MAFESSGAILYVAKISYQSDNWFGNLGREKNVFTHTYRKRERERERESERERERDR